MADTSELLPITDDAPVVDVLTAVAQCAAAWEPGARLLGNVRACDILRAVTYAKSRLQAEARATCPYCKGKGHVPGDPEGAPIEDCPKCSGSGLQAEAQAPADPMDGLAAAAFKVEASRMLQQIESKSVPMLDWNKRVARLAKFVLHSLSTHAQAEAQAPAVTRDELRGVIREHVNIGHGHALMVADAILALFARQKDQTSE